MDVSELRVGQSNAHRRLAQVEAIVDKMVAK